LNKLQNSILLSFPHLTLKFFGPGSSFIFLLTHLGVLATKLTKIKYRTVTLTFNGNISKILLYLSRYNMFQNGNGTFLPTVSKIYSFEENI